MGAISEVIETPLTREALAGRYLELCADPRFANLQGKIELDLWGRILMSPASNYHGVLQSRISQRLLPLGGQAIAEASVLTAAGLLVADVAWASADFMRAHAGETPFTQAPELCIEISSPSNSTKELREKIAAYLAAGALETWIIYPQSKRCEFHAHSGLLQQSRFALDFSGLFD
ncbi:MAG: Uma2 family endonuclease [Betaproteobacteria bacterium]|nr:Uma2 family endonuclease [Betaproteobacteria bacterium]